MEERNERPNVGGVSIRSRNGAPSRKRCVVDGHMTKASKKMGTPPPVIPSSRLLHNATESSVGGAVGSIDAVPLHAMCLSTCSGGESSKNSLTTSGMPFYPTYNLSICTSLLLSLPIINTSYQKLPFGSGDYPDKLLFHQAPN